MPSRGYSNCSAWRASHCSGFSRCRAQPLGSRLSSTGLVAPQHVGSSQTGNETHVPYIGRRILNHWTTREVPFTLLRGDDRTPAQNNLSQNRNLELPVTEESGLAGPRAGSRAIRSHRAVSQLSFQTEVTSVPGRGSLPGTAVSSSRRKTSCVAHTLLSILSVIPTDSIILGVGVVITPTPQRRKLRSREARPLEQSHRAGIQTQAPGLQSLLLAPSPPQTDPFLGMMMALGGGMDFDSKKAYR